MGKRMFSVLLVAVAIALMGYGYLHEAGAADYACQNFNIRLDSVERGGGEVFLYKYVVTSGAMEISKISHLSFGIDASLTVFDNNKLTVYPPGAGGLADGWLAGVPQLQVLTITAQEYTESDPLVIEVAGTGGNVGPAAGYYKAGNKIEACFIDGPVPGLPVDVSIPSTKQVVLNDVEYCIDIDPMTGCPVPGSNIYECDNPSNVLPFDGSFKIGGDEGPDYPTMIYGEGADPRCPVSKAAHNPCQWVLLAGRAYGPVCW